MSGQRSVLSRVRGLGWLACAIVSVLYAFNYQMARAETPWSVVGPNGGDARSFAAVPGEPNHLYLGTTNSWIYESRDAGTSWVRLAKIDEADDLVLDHILVNPANPKNIMVAAWNINHKGGGLWVSHDAGRSWKEADGLRDNSIRAFTAAPSNPRILVAGTLQGVYRSDDAGASWTMISPAGSNEIHEIESLAVDPADPNIIYAGTWHLPWKTTDGGKTWQNIKQGMIEDSDVFSIIVDPAQPSVVYTSACSGIYKSEDAGALFHKIQGIPASARRTRVLKQNPANHEVVYAGTTEGLYKTVDGGKTFKRMTGPDVIVNDVFIDSKNPQHVLLATDRSGVLLSNDAGTSFVAANDGFSGRQVEALLVDSKHPGRLFAGVVNDKMYGGVFVSQDDGAHWNQIGEGLDGRDVIALAEAPDGTVLAGTNNGIFELRERSGAVSRAEWEPRNTIQQMVVRQTVVIRNGKKVHQETKTKERSRELTGYIYALDLSGDAWLASGSAGLLTSRDHGLTWQGGPVRNSGEFRTVAAHGSYFVAASRNGLVVVSSEAGQTWTEAAVPGGPVRIDRAIFSGDGTAWMGGRAGVYASKDEGKTWEWIERFPFREVNDLYYDRGQDRVLVSSSAVDSVYAIDPAGLKWTLSHAGWKISLIRADGGRMLAASLYDGVLVAPPTERAAAELR